MGDVAGVSGNWGDLGDHSESSVADDDLCENGERNIGVSYYDIHEILG
jgi:hypothetical protein